jgi:hypothetical protein
MNEKKFELLGEPIGTATAKLRKSVLFKLVQILELDVCFQCGEKIEDVADLSIEHKVPWQSAENPRESFYDLDNISFSHIRCNIVAANRRVIHPTQRGELHHGSKLSNDTVRNIKKDLELGCRGVDLVAKYNINKRVISNIKTGVQWKSIN